MSNLSDIGQDNPGTARDSDPDSFWLGMARQAWSDSTQFMDTSLRRRWEKSLKHFLGEHAPGSRYLRDDYKNKSRRFYPKTRAVIRAGEAALAAALFSSNDLISCEPGDADNPNHRIAASIHQTLLQYRLTKSIKWFQTAIGAYQLAANYGMCISYNWWETKTTTDLSVGADGEVIKTQRTVHDRPRIDLIAGENVRFSPDSDWREPLQDSPYLILDVPMRAGEVLERMESDAEGGRISPWRQYTMAEVIAAGQQATDSTRAAREGKQNTDSHEVNSGNTEFTIVWLRKFFIRVDSEDYLFWTIGDSLLLSDPIPAKHVYFHGKRPYTHGIVNIEALRTHPAGTNELIAPLQEDLNDIRNQRSENIALALNRRWLVKRGETIDMAALMRNVPGGGIAVDDTDKSVKELSFNDVTGSSYQEQDRIDLSIDEISGHFSQSSVMSNRQLNETVGGMRMLSDNAFAMQEYGVRIFVETWVEPTLEQLRLLEAYYESDAVVLHLAAQKAGAYEELQGLGIVNIGQVSGEILDRLLQQDVSVQVNVGMGATDPDRRMRRFVTAVQTSLTLAPSEGQRLNAEEIRKEVFSISGQKNGERFFLPAEEVQQAGEPPELAIKRLEAETSKYRADKEFDAKMAGLQVERELGMANIASRENLTMAQLYERLGLEREKLDKTNQTQRDIAAANNLAKEADRLVKAEVIQVQNRELSYKDRTGMPGI